MTVAIAGLWELGHNAPISEAHLWEMVIRDFMVDEWHMSPVTGIEETLVEEWQDAAQMIKAMRELMPLVFVTESAATELADFKHPTDACYVFGKCNWSPFINLKSGDDLAVRVDTPADKGLLWPHQCATAVLWHRRQQL